MAKEKEEDKKAEATEEQKPKSKKKLFIIIGAVVLLAGAGAAFALMGGGGKEGEGHEGEEATHEEEVKHLATIPLDTIIVNLSENSSFLKVRMTLEYDPEVIAKASHGGEGGGGTGGGGESAGPPVFTERLPMIRDAVIRTLSAKTPAQVLSPDGKERIKEELIEAINEALGLEEGPVVNLYFNEFIVQ